MNRFKQLYSEVPFFVNLLLLISLVASYITIWIYYGTFTCVMTLMGTLITFYCYIFYKLLDKFGYLSRIQKQYKALPGALKKCFSQEN